MGNRRIHEHTYPPAEYTRVEGRPLPPRRLVEIWRGLREEERFSFILSLDEAIADKVIDLCELPAPPAESKKPMPEQQKKILSGGRVYGSEEERRRSEQAIADAERLLGRQRPAASKSAAEVLRGIEESSKRTSEALAQAKQLHAEMEAERTTTTTNVADPTNTLDRMATERAAKDGSSYGDALAKVAYENPVLYAQHSQNVIDGRTATPLAMPIQASETPMQPATAIFDQLVTERAASERISYSKAASKVAAERPALYAQYVREVTP